MAEYSPPNSKEAFEKNFTQLKPLMNATEAYHESSRCLFCYDAPCVQACPTGIDIPLFIRQINSGNLKGSAETIYNSNYFGHACGKVCPTEVLCEGACVYNHQDVKPIEIGRLQSHAVTHLLSRDEKIFTPGAPIGKKVAVIGAGPAGIACACELRRAGVEVVIYESQPQPSGLTLYGVAPYKITNEEALRETEWLQSQLGFEIKYNHRMTSRTDFEMLEIGFDAIFIGIGLGATRSMKLPNESLNHIFGAAEFIAHLRIAQHEVKAGKKVIVIGGGNTAMDAAGECARLGSEQVILAYRGTKDQMSAYEFEFDLAKAAGVKGIFSVQPVEFMGATKVTGVKFIRTQNVNGKTTPIEGSEFIEPCDMVIRATGQEKQTALLANIPGIQFDSAGRIVVNEHFQTGNEKYFAAGDCVNGGKEIVNAVAEGKAAGLGILNLMEPSTAGRRGKGD